MNFVLCPLFLHLSLQVYRRLFEHFKTEKNKSALSVPDMSKMGMKITGATGEAKLKVQQMLSLCDFYLFIYWVSPKKAK